MRRQLKLHKRKAMVGITEVPEEITANTNIQKMLLPDVAYQVLPGIMERLTIDIQTVILNLLPHSKHQLIDITLPFTHSEKNSNPERMLGRYLLLGQRLIGVKTCLCASWPVQKVQKTSPSRFLQNHNYNNRESLYQQQILMGNFYLQLSNCRIALFFQSQLLQTPSLLQLVSRYKCDIISIVANVQKQFSRDGLSLKINIQQMELVHKLKQIAREQQITVMYAGSKIVPSISTVYWERSFIMQGEFCKSIPRALIGQPSHIILAANLELTLISKWKVDFIILDQETQEEIVCLEKLDVNYYLQSERQIPKTMLRQGGLSSKRFLSDLVGIKQITIYHLFYLFRTVHRGSPFFIPHPFTKQREELYEQLRILSSSSPFNLDQLVRLYSVKGQTSKSLQVTVYPDIDSLYKASSELVPGLIFLYCQESEEIQRLKKNSSVADKICNCQALLPFAFKQPQSEKSLSLKKLNMACVQVLNRRYKSVEEILSYFWDRQFNRQQIQKCFAEILPAKVKKYFKLSPHYLFLLHSSPQKVVVELGDAQIRLKSSKREKLGEEEHPFSVSSGNEKKLSQKIQASKQYKNRINQLFKCHLCSLNFKKQLVFNCSSCKKYLCFDCLDILTHHSLFDLSDYKCAICLGKCNCNVCKPSKVEKMVVQPQSKEREHRFFKPTVFECTRCEILGQDYAMIRLICAQCKDPKCYNCARLSKELDLTNLSSWICELCQNFNEGLKSKPSQQSLQAEVLESLIIGEAINRSLTKEKALLGRSVSSDSSIRERVNKEYIYGTSLKLSNQPQKRQHRLSSSGNSKGSSHSSSKSRSRSRSKSDSRSIKNQRNNNYSPIKSHQHEAKQSKFKGKPLWNKSGQDKYLNKRNNEKSYKIQEKKAHTFKKEETQRLWSKDSSCSKDKNFEEPKKVTDKKPTSHEKSGLIFDMKPVSDHQSFSY